MSAILYALADTTGTAISGTGLCLAHYVPETRLRLWLDASAETRLRLWLDASAEKNAAPPAKWVDATGNDELTCVKCEDEAMTPERRAELAAILGRVDPDERH